MNQSSQSENKWELSPDQLDTRCGPDYEVGEEIEGHPQWFRYNGQTLSGDTEQEIVEQKQAIKEQLRLGIIKVPKGAQRGAPALAPNAMGAMNPQMQQFMRLLKEDPKNIAPHLGKGFRPKVRDNRTGKVRKLGPNDRCPCGSGKKFKKCHGRGKF